MQVLNANLNEQLATLIARCSTECGFTVAYTVQDLESGLVISNDADVPIPSASLIKLFIFATFLSRASADHTLPFTTVTITSHDVVLGSGIIKGLPLPQVMTVAELCQLMIQQSDNTAANILIRLLSFPGINATAKVMGADRTVLNRYMMAPYGNANDNFTCCADIAKFYRLLMKSSIPGANLEWSEWALRTIKDIKNDRLGSRLGPEVVTAAKSATGTTVMHDSVVLFNSVLIIVMIRSAAGSFNRPTSPEFASALRLFGDIGKIVFDWRTSINDHRFVSRD